VDVFAAMDATLSSAHARPGDAVLLLTDDHRGTWDYSGLAAENHQLIYLYPVSDSFPASACGEARSRLVGALSWRDNTGGVAFSVPDLPEGPYWLFMQTVGQCWRIAGTTMNGQAPLLLLIGTTPAENQKAAKQWGLGSVAPSPRSSVQRLSYSAVPGDVALRWLLIAMGIVLAGITGVAVRWRVGKTQRR
jgi:hypothetical protein